MLLGYLYLSKAAGFTPKAAHGSEGQFLWWFLCPPPARLRKETPSDGEGTQ